MPQTVAPLFEPRGGEAWREPWPAYKALRDHDPVHYAEWGDFWVLSQFQDTFDAARDTSTFSSAQGLTHRYGELEELGMEAAPIVMMDPPEHTAFRRIVAKGFTPRQVALIEPAVRAYIVERLEPLLAAGEGDIVEALFKPLPSFVVAHYLGVPPEDRALFDRWTNAIVAANAEGDAIEAGDAVAELLTYFSELIERRRVEPGDDMISELVQADLAPEHEMLQILGFGFTMVTGGNDTTTGLLSGAAELLTANPDQRQVLLDDPAAIAGSVDEFLRLTSPVQNLARTTTRPVSIQGVDIPAAKKVMLLYASANRDEREFGPTVDQCNVTRRNQRIMSFSYGPHHCLGAAAARLQAQVALEELLSRCPDFTVDAAAGSFAPGAFVRRYESLPFQANS
jgi:cytochrome P450